MRREEDAGLYTVEFPTTEVSYFGRSDEIDEQRAIAASLMPVFYPSAVAVIGASRDPNSIGGRLFTNLINGDFTGPVFPVNPNADEGQCGFCFEAIHPEDQDRMVRHVFRVQRKELRDAAHEGSD